MRFCVCWLNPSWCHPWTGGDQWWIFKINVRATEQGQWKWSAFAEDYSRLQSFMALTVFLCWSSMTSFPEFSHPCVCVCVLPQKHTQNGVKLLPHFMPCVRLALWRCPLCQHWYWCCVCVSACSFLSVFFKTHMFWPSFHSSLVIS